MITKESKIIITGAAGFIASCLATYLNKDGYSNILLVDDFSKKEKDQNTHSFNQKVKIDRAEFINNIEQHQADYIIHLGARTDTTEMDYNIHKELNLEYTKTIWNHCVKNEIPLIYASSAATYGSGEHGYKDDHEQIDNLTPLNPYGKSKQQFDQYALAQTESPPQWYGLKFFNVFGPNEYHKGRMASVIFHAFNQIKETGGMKLFRSHHPDYTDGGQMRDFVYVKDVLFVINWLMQNNANNGIYNLGSGQARTFNDLVKSVFTNLALEENISFIDTPADIRDKYQYYTEADMNKLKRQGYPHNFHSLEEGVQDYVKEYLMETNYF